MTGSVLVAYATKYGSTQEVAEAVAAEMRECGIDVEIEPLRNVRTLAGYSGVVMGAPLYMLHWHKDALNFLRQHRDALAGLPVAVFALGPWNDAPNEWQEVRGELDKELAKFPWFAPVSIKIVGGKFDPAKLTFPWSLVPALKKMPAKDIRDFAAIRAWTDELGVLLQRAPPA